MSLHDLDLNHTWAGKSQRNLSTDVILRVILLLHRPLLVQGMLLSVIGEFQVCSWLAFVVGDQRLTLQAIDTAVEVSWFQ